jgi:VIT1/CCC1 family predicted Fe2+/Mn2+ transporter
MFSFIIPFTIALLHFLIYSFMPVVIILSILSAIACWLVMGSISNKSWDMIKANYEG